MAPKLFASSTAIDTRFIVKLSDQQPQDDAARRSGAQPAFVPVSKGWLNASHREKIEKRSTPTRPFYTHTNPQPIEPGKVYEFDIEVLPVSYVFKKGYRIRLEIANGDLAATDSVSSCWMIDADGDGYVPSRRQACVVHHAAGDVRHSRRAGHSGARRQARARNSEPHIPSPLSPGFRVRTP